MSVPVPVLDPGTAYRQAMRLSLPCREDIQRATALIPRAPARVSRLGRRYEAPRWFLTVSPGTLRLSVKTMAEKERPWKNDGMDEDEQAEVTRGRISSFSAKSRARMCDVFRSLDYAPMFDADDFPALVTLTSPADWESVFPTPESWARKRERFFIMFERAWGIPLACVWKTEFQERGAPHLHMLMTPPRGLSRGQGIAKGLPFKQWLSVRWAQIVGVADPDGFADHVKAGTNVDWREGQRYSDPKRIATYFDKHSGYHEKEYQNEWPQLWRDAVAAGGAGTNIWGYTRSLEKVNEVVPLARNMGAKSRPGRAAFATDEGPVMNRHAQPNAAVLAGLVDGRSTGIMSVEMAGATTRMPALTAARASSSS